MINKGYLQSIIESILKSDSELLKILRPVPNNLKPLYVYEAKMVSKKQHFLFKFREFVNQINKRIQTKLLFQDGKKKLIKGHIMVDANVCRLFFDINLYYFDHHRILKQSFYLIWNKIANSAPSVCFG